MIDKNLEFISVMMETNHASEYPRYSVPEGYSIVGYRDGFETDWARIQCLSFDSGTIESSTEKFMKLFGANLPLARTNCLFLLNPEGVPVSIGSLWMSELNGKICPRLHYIATDPEYEGKGLCKALLTAVFDLQKAQGLGEYMFLTSQTWSFAAIRLYERFGFKPYVGRECPSVWSDYPDYAEKNPRAWEIIRARQAEFERYHR